MLVWTCASWDARDARTKLRGDAADIVVVDQDQVGICFCVHTGKIGKSVNVANHVLFDRVKVICAPVSRGNYKDSMYNKWGILPSSPPQKARSWPWEPLQNADINFVHRT